MLASPWDDGLIDPPFFFENKLEPFSNYAEVLHILLYNLSLHGPRFQRMAHLLRSRKTEDSLTFEGIELIMISMISMIYQWHQPINDVNDYHQQFLAQHVQTTFPINANIYQPHLRSPEATSLTPVGSLFTQVQRWMPCPWEFLSLKLNVISFFCNIFKSLKGHLGKILPLNYLWGVLSSKHHYNFIPKVSNVTETVPL